MEHHNLKRRVWGDPKDLWIQISRFKRIYLRDIDAAVAALARLGLEQAEVCKSTWIEGKEYISQAGILLTVPTIRPLQRDLCRKCCEEIGRPKRPKRGHYTVSHRRGGEGAYNGTYGTSRTFGTTDELKAAGYGGDEWSWHWCAEPPCEACGG